MSPAGRRRLLVAVIIFPVLAVMSLTLSDGSVAEQDNGSSYEIIAPELEITKVNVPQRVGKGSQVYIRVTVTNRGDATSMQTRLLIKDQRTDEIESEARVPSIGPGQEWRVEMEVFMKVDHRKMYIHLDPDDTVNERGSEVNVWAFNLDVLEQSYRGPSYLAVTVLAVVAMGAVMALARKRRLSST